MEADPLHIPPPQASQLLMGGYDIPDYDTLSEHDVQHGAVLTLVPREPAVVIQVTCGPLDLFVGDLDMRVFGVEWQSELEGWGFQIREAVLWPKERLREGLTRVVEHAFSEHPLRDRWCELRLAPTTATSHGDKKQVDLEEHVRDYASRREARRISADMTVSLVQRAEGVVRGEVGEFCFCDNGAYTCVVDCEDLEHCYDRQNPRCTFYASNSCGFSLFGVNVWFSVLALNAFFSLLAVNAFGSMFSVNSVLSIGSINSFFSIGCVNKFFTDCYGKGVFGCLTNLGSCFAHG